MKKISTVLDLSGLRVNQALAGLGRKIREILPIIMWPSRKKTQERKAICVQKHTALTEAVLRSDYVAMRRIVAAGADLNKFDDFRMTPLLWAIMGGRH
jgi:hypothetical protein